MRRHGSALRRAVFVDAGDSGYLEQWRNSELTQPRAGLLRLASALVNHALTLFDGPAVLKAQSRLRRYYEGFGFVVVGPEFDEDGILHVPMRLER